TRDVFLRVSPAHRSAEPERAGVVRARWQAVSSDGGARRSGTDTKPSRPVVLGVTNLARRARPALFLARASSHRACARALEPPLTASLLDPAAERGSPSYFRLLGPSTESLVREL